MRTERCDENRYALHDVCSWFPGMTNEEFQHLREDIRENGMRTPVIVHGDQIIDGQHRVKAAHQVGAEVVYQHIGEEADPIAWAVSANLHRRHLNPSQRGMLAARLAVLKQGQHSDEEGTPTAKEAAKDVGVGVRTVQRASKVVRNGDPSVQEAVRDGAVSVRDAEQAVAAPADAQKRAVDGVRSGKAGTLQESLRMNGDLFETESAGAQVGGIDLDEDEDGGEQSASPEEEKEEPAAEAGKSPKRGGKAAHPVTEEEASRARSALGSIGIEVAGDRKSRKVTLSERVFAADADEVEWDGRVWLRPSTSGAVRDDELILEGVDAIRTGECRVLLVEVEPGALCREAVAKAVGHAVAIALPAGDGECGRAAVLLGPDAEPDRLKSAWAGAGTVWVPAGSQ